MQLLGIDIKPEGENVNKILKPGWYPFGDFKKPDDFGFVRPVKPIPSEIEGIYSFGNTQIRVNAIVGKNGSGKSSLIEILFRIINNFAKVLLGKEKSDNDRRHLKYAYGVHADLHYEVDGQQYRITCRGVNVSLERIFENKKPEGNYIKSTPDVNEKLKRFFYTIVTNYSLYAYNERDYKFEAESLTSKSAKPGEWLTGLFHKNDGYFTPLVLTPYRKDGIIDANNENTLARQRIVRLALLAYLNSQSLLPNYDPDRLTLSLKEPDYKLLHEDLQSRLDRRHRKLDLTVFISELEKIWKSVIRREAKSKLWTTNDPLFKRSIEYIVNKTLKIALTYSDYEALIWKGYKDFPGPLSEFITDRIPENLKRLVDKIFRDFSETSEHNHITLKLEQTYRFIMEYINDGKAKWRDGQRINVADFLKDRRAKNYSELSTLLPPPIFDIDIRFRRKEDESQLSSWDISDRRTLTLSQLSSGERQLLYSLSYVLYHIKNIESVRDDTNRVAYNHICLIFDEIELYFHPEYQRRFVSRLVDSMKWCNISSDRIRSVQIILVTHSPFILTDLFNHNILYLSETGKRIRVRDESFGANYYSLLNKSFFFDKSAVGDYSSRFMGRMVDKAKEGDGSIRQLLPYLGDQFVRNIALDLLDNPEQLQEHLSPNS